MGWLGELIGSLFGESIIKSLFGGKPAGEISPAPPANRGGVFAGLLTGMAWVILLASLVNLGGALFVGASSYDLIPYSVIGFVVGILFLLAARWMRRRS